jgi:hypothetical protein
MISFARIGFEALSASARRVYIAAMPELQRSTCLVCDRPPHIRGLCSRCYAEARVAIADDVTSDDELVRRGLMLPKYSRKKLSLLMAALQRGRTGEVTSPEGQQLVVAGEAVRESSESCTYVCVVGCDVKEA